MSDAGPDAPAGAAGAPVDAGPDVDDAAQEAEPDASCPEAVCAQFGTFQGLVSNCPGMLIGCFGGNVTAICHDPTSCQAGPGGQYPVGCACIRLGGTVYTCATVETPGLTCATGAPAGGLQCQDCST